MDILTSLPTALLLCHKLVGPHLGALCGRKDVARLLCCDDGLSSDDETLYRLMEMGTINYEACAGVEGY